MTPKAFVNYADGAVRKITCNIEISPPGEPRDAAQPIQLYQGVYQPVEIVETHVGPWRREAIRWPDDVRYVKGRDLLVIDA
jgi:hypothetical protein